MDVKYILSTILLLFLIFQLITGIFLTYHSIKKRMLNVGILGLGFILAFISTLLVYLNIFNWNQVSPFLMLSFFLPIPFTKLTFYKDVKNNIFDTILTLGISGYIIKIILAYMNELVVNQIINHLSIIVEAILIMVSFGYLSISAYNASKELEMGDESVEPWIIARLKIVAISSGVMAFNGVPELVSSFLNVYISSNTQFSIFILVILVLITIFFSTGNLIAWIMPEKFKSYINQRCGYERNLEEEVDYSEDEIMDKMEGGNI